MNHAKITRYKQKTSNNANDATENASEKDEKAQEIQADDVHKKEKTRARKLFSYSSALCYNYLLLFATRLRPFIGMKG